MSAFMTQYLLYPVLVTVLALPLGIYISRVMNGERVFLTPVLAPCERFVYRLLGVEAAEEMSWKGYAAAVSFVSGLSLALLMAILMLQRFLPLNPLGLSGMNWDLAFNTAASFVTNTNWQAYSGEFALSSFSQAIGLTVQNFLSAAVGIAVLFALIRGLSRVRTKGLGSFWVDITRAVLYVLLPLSLLLSVALVSQGVVQNLKAYETVTLVEPLQLEDGRIVTEQFVPMGPQASQVAPKQLGTNGGGFNGTNSASPLENPTPFSNLLQLLSILLIPAALCFSFGRSVGDRKQGHALFIAMFAVLLLSLGAVAWYELKATPQLAQQGAVNLTAVGQAGGNMEGKETRFGIASSSAWAVFTTAASNGSVNSMHDSYTPVGGLITMLMIQLGEVIFGGAGSGLYGMLAFVIFTVFIAGLMVGRTPEYLGKKIEPFEMKMAVLVCLATPVAILAACGLAALLPSSLESLGNSGPHGFSELLYAYTSAGGNNGSAFAGFRADTVFFNLSLGLSMLFARFLPLIATLAAAGSFAAKKRVASGAGTLSTSGATFVFLLIFVVLLIGALSFVPALALGPVAEELTMAGL